MKRGILSRGAGGRGGGLPAAFSFELNLHRVTGSDSPAVSFNLVSNILPAAPEAFGRLTWEDVE
jgi:hypothetical protein